MLPAPLFACAVLAAACTTPQPAPSAAIKADTAAIETDSGPQNDDGKPDAAAVEPTEVTEIEPETAGQDSDAPPDLEPEATDTALVVDAACAGDTAQADSEPADAVADFACADVGDTLEIGDASDATSTVDVPIATSETAANGDDGAPAAPPANLFIELTGKPALPGNTLVVQVVPAAIAATSQPFVAGSVTVFDGPLPVLPVKLPLMVPAGKWAVVAMLLAAGQPMPQEGAVHCAAEALAYVEPALAPVTIALQLQKMSQNIATLADFCVGPTGLPAVVPPLLAEQLWVTTPATAAGGAHFVGAHVVNDRLWIAGTQDGLVSFDFATDVTATAPMQNWQVHGGAMCNRIARNANTLFCASRAGYLHIASIAAPGAQLNVVKTYVTAGIGATEGLAVSKNWLYIALHQAGLAAIASVPPFGQPKFTVPAQLTDTWEVQPLGEKHLLVANGAKGLAVLDIGADPLAPTVVGQLQLPGTAAYLDTLGNLAVVGALGGGLHVVNLSLPTAPQLVGTLTLPANVYGVQLTNSHIFAAVGSHVLAVATPALNATGPLFARAALPSPHFALDLELHGNGLLTAEFQSVRRLVIDAAQSTDTPVLVTLDYATSAVTAVGATMTVQLPVHNAGALPLTVAELLWRESQALNVPIVIVPGSWTVAAGATIVIQATVTKTQKGVLDHEFYLKLPNAKQPSATVPHRETTWPQVGNKLPQMPTYSAGKGNLFNIGDHFKGKVGVLLVAAQSCPVAFQALAAAERDLLPLVAAGKIAALVVNPWDTPLTAEVAAFTPKLPLVYSGLTTKDNHDWSLVLDVELGQPVLFGPPMPVVYVVGKDGKIVLARWGYQSQRVLAAVDAALNM